MSNDFNGLGLSAKVTSAVADAGYTSPTEIQAQAIPHVLEGKDIIGIAQTGTGKTASFVLPMLTRLESGRARARMPRTLILEPTRELAAQVAENFEKYGKNHKLTMALLIGGVSFDEQNKILDRGADVLIATPGRMLDQFERGRILLNGVDILVIDEADRMLDMGFIPDIERICGLLPKRRQTLFFSATMAPEIEKLTKRFLRDPIKIEVAHQNKTADTIDQKLIRVSSKPDEKRAALRGVIRGETELTNAIIFCNRKRDVATLARSLARHGFDAGGLHGDMDQKSRTETLDKFRGGNLKFLIASDVAARGLDIPAVSHVFNFDVPTHAEDYVHRIGRTGRAGRAGTSITLATSSDSKYLDAIQKLIQRDIPELKLGETDVERKRAPAAADDKPRRAEKPAPAAVEAATQSDDAPAADSAAQDAPPASESKPRRSRGRGRGRGRSGETAPAAAAAAPAEDAPASPAPASAPQREKAERKAPANSPFGNDGPIPAFLLVPGRAG